MRGGLSRIPSSRDSHTSFFYINDNSLYFATFTRILTRVQVIVRHTSNELCSKLLVYYNNRHRMHTAIRNVNTAMISNHLFKLNGEQ